jgi:Leucine-rich repeat (LRR) protein
MGCGSRNSDTSVATPTEKQLKATQDEFAKLGGTYAALPDPSTNKIDHCFYLHETNDEALNKMPNPTFAFNLSVSGPNVSDEGLKGVGRCKLVGSLLISDTKITQTGLRELRGLGHLSVLGLINNDRVSAEGLKELQTLPQLTELSLIYMRISDSALENLTQLKQLTMLVIKRKPATPRDPTDSLTASGLKKLGEFKNLTSLTLFSCPLDDSVLTELKQLHDLKSLVISGAHITDLGLLELKELKNLTRLALEHTQVTDEGVKELQSALPKCAILR